MGATKKHSARKLAREVLRPLMALATGLIAVLGLVL